MFGWMEIVRKSEVLTWKSQGVLLAAGRGSDKGLFVHRAWMPGLMPVIGCSRKVWGQQHPLKLPKHAATLAEVSFSLGHLNRRVIACRY